MDIRVIPGVAKGVVSAPPSKSMAHRQLITAGLSNRTSIIENLEYSEDIRATVDCLTALGAKIVTDEQMGKAVVQGCYPFRVTDSTVLPCRESGSTIRFFIPLALLDERPIAFTGAGRLMERPMAIYEQLCREQGLQYTRDCQGIRLCGPMHSGKFTLPGDVSSQFLTGLLFALPLMKGESEIILTTSLESRPYVDLTLSALQDAGICVQEATPERFIIPGNQAYTATGGSVEGDYSNAAFLESFNLLGGQVMVEGLREGSLQGDRIYRTYFRQLNEGCPVLDMHNCPDLAPILMTMAAALNGCTLQGTRRLKIKESDRGVVMEQELRKFGAKIQIYDDMIVVNKTELHEPTEMLEGHNDHRVVMSLAVLATKYGGEICGAQAVAKSYPSFWDVIQALGIKIETL